MVSFKNWIGVLLVSGALLACDDKEEVVQPEPVIGNNIYVLGEGMFNGNNASLTQFNPATGTIVADVFAQVNGRGLGDIANDMIVHGSKMYIVMNGSSTVEVIDAKTSKSLKQIGLKNEGVGRQPRFATTYKNKVLISNYDGSVAVLDTASLEVEKYIGVGRNPERLVTVGEKVYVANSGGLDFPNYDNTVSVIDMNRLEEVEKIQVTMNPNTVFTDAHGDLYVYSVGNYSDVSSTLTILDASTRTVKAVTDFAAASFAIHGDLLYFLQFSGNVGVYDLKTDQIVKAQFITDGTTFMSPYSISVDTTTGEVFVTDAKNYSSAGEVVVLDKEGKKKYSIQAGIAPNKVILY